MTAAETLKAVPSSKLRSLKALCSLVCFLLLASNVWSMSHWNEARGVYDDVCYLRSSASVSAFRARRFRHRHFQGRRSVRGVQAEGDRFSDLERSGNGPLSHIDAGFRKAGDPVSAGHRPAAGAISARASGDPALCRGLGSSCSALRWLGIAAARTVPSVVVAGALGFLAIYLMINPSKASYSMAPTMAACALAGYLTARLLIDTPPSRRVVMASLLGLVLGVSVNFRLPNLFLASGYVLFLLAAFLSSRKISAFIARPRLRYRVRLRNGADADFERDQRRQSAGDHLWRARDVTPARFLL